MPILIHGKVTDAKGEPVAQARIFIKESAVAVPDIAMLTDNGGAFSLSVPAPGNYTIGCNADGFAPAEETVTAREGQEASMELRLRK